MQEKLEENEFEKVLFSVIVPYFIQTANTANIMFAFETKKVPHATVERMGDSPRVNASQVGRMLKNLLSILIFF